MPVPKQGRAMTKHTILNATHRAAGAKMVDFGGWDMPLHYGSQIEEHHAVRRDAGMFDVSHMTVVDLHGARCRDFLRHLLANSVDRLKKPGKALYSCMLNERGGVIDDLIVYFLAEGASQGRLAREAGASATAEAEASPDMRRTRRAESAQGSVDSEREWFRVVVNAATRDKDLAWIERQAAPFGVTVSERADLAMIAVQGPHAPGCWACSTRPTASAWRSWASSPPPRHAVRAACRCSWRAPATPARMASRSSCRRPTR